MSRECVRGRKGVELISVLITIISGAFNRSHSYRLFDIGLWMPLWWLNFNAFKRFHKIDSFAVLRSKRAMDRRHIVTKPNYDIGA